MWVLKALVTSQPELLMQQLSLLFLLFTFVFNFQVAFNETAPVHILMVESATPTSYAILNKI